MSTISPATVATTTWSIDPAHSSVEFAVRHLMISNVKGRFSDVKGSLVGNEAGTAEASVEVSIGVQSIDTREAQRDAHLRSADFFDVDHFPEMTFRSTRAERLGEGRFPLAGALTIHGVTRDVVLDVTSEGRTTDPWGGERAGFAATTRIRRSDFGLTWNQILEAGGVVVGDEVKVSIDVELVKQAAPSAA
jgi:polyisoprenoid-binding protein YceI